MSELLLSRPPWYVVGAILGLVVVASIAALNARVGVTGGYSAWVERLTGRAAGLGGPGWLVLGVLAGAVLFRVLAGGDTVGDGYGWLTRTFTGGAEVVVPLVLFGGGVLIGYGAKTAGGCTSGHGICGTALGSRASLVATGTFMVTAVAATFVLGWVL